MRSIVREAFSGASPPLVDTGRDLIPGPALGPTSGELDQLARLLETPVPGVDQAEQGRQQPDFAALLAGLEVPGVGGSAFDSIGGPQAAVAGDVSQVDALAGLDALAAGIAGSANGGDAFAAAIPDAGAGGLAGVDALAGLDSIAADIGAGLPVPGVQPAQLPVQVPVQPPAVPFQLPLPVPQPAPLPQQAAGPLPQQAPGPQAPSVKIVGPQPIYISSDKVIGPSVNGAGRSLTPGFVEEGRQSQLTGDQLQILRALRTLF